MENLKFALTLAGIAHFGILLASFTVPKALNWWENLELLPKLLRQLFWVYGAFIVFMIVSFAVITLAHTEALAKGEYPLARLVCGVIALFWFIRLLVQFFVLDPGPFLTKTFYRIGYHSLTVVFIFLTTVYAWAALFSR